jgi:hypothetical protein
MTVMIYDMAGRRRGGLPVRVTFTPYSSVAWLGIDSNEWGDNSILEKQSVRELSTLKSRKATSNHVSTHQSAQID